MVPHLHPLWNGHHSKCRHHLSQYIVITVLWTSFHMCCVTLLWLIHYITNIAGCLYHLILFTYFTQSPTPLPLATTRLSCVSKSWLPFCFDCLFCFLDPTYKWSHVVFVFFWLILFSIILPGCIHVVVQGKISFFCVWLSSILYCIYTTPSWASLAAQLVKNFPAMQETLVRFLGGKIPWRREMIPTPVFWPGEFHGLFHGVTESQAGLSVFHFHIWFTHSSTNGHVLCFHVLAIK